MIFSKKYLKSAEPEKIWKKKSNGIWTCPRSNITNVWIYNINLQTIQLINVRSYIFLKNDIIFSVVKVKYIEINFGRIRYF